MSSPATADAAPARRAPEAAPLRCVREAAPAHPVPEAAPGRRLPEAAPVRRVLVYRSSLLSTSETFVLAQAQALQRWQPTLVGEQRVPGLALPDALPMLALGAGQWHWPRRLQRRWARWRGRPVAHDVQQLAPLQARLMHAHFGTDGVDVAPLARALGLPLLVTLHGFDVHVRADHWQSGQGGWGMRSYPARLRALGQTVGPPGVYFCAVSQDVARQAQACGIAAGRIAVLPIGVDVQQFRPGPQPLAQRAVQVLFVGRLVEKKGCRDLIEAMASPALRALRAELVVVGAGPLRAALQQQAQALGVAARFTGALDAAQVLQCLAQARVLCLPSVTAANGDAEGFGLVLLEAQACGVPVVTSARGGRDEGLVDGVTGHAVAERDAAALAAALARVLDPTPLGLARLDGMARAARAFVQQHFDIRDCTRALEAHYDDIVAAHR